MTFAKDIGLGKQLDLRCSHLKLRQRGNSVSAKILSFLQMIIKGNSYRLREKVKAGLIREPEVEENP